MPGGLAAGQLVDERYALEEPLAEDSLGTVWRAFDRGLEREVALRDVHFPGGLFREEPQRLQDALRAARLAIRLDHPGAVHVYDAFVDGDHLVLVTELVPGRSLASLVDRKGALPPKRAAAIGLDLLSPLEALHSLGLAHGALAPTGVVVADKGRARLTELGLAPSFLDAASVTWAHAAGTPACLAPEQLRHEGAGPAADMWALGATLYYAVEGAHAFPSVDGVPADPPRLPSRAGALWPVLERLLAKAPADRPSPADIRADLAAIAGVPAAGDEDATGRRGRRDRRSRHRGAPATGPETGAEEGAAPDEPERDWGAVIAREAAPSVPSAAAEPGWQDWSPGEVPDDSSDVWLPGANLDQAPIPEPDSPGGANGDGPARAAAPPEAEPADDRFGEAFGDARTFDPSDEATAALAAAGQEADEARRFRASPSWPPPDSRRGPIMVGLCFLVIGVLVALLVTNGAIRGSGSGSTIPAAQRPVLSTDPGSVPAEWISYRHAPADMGISHPPSWVVAPEGRGVLLRDTAGAAQLRLDHRRDPGDDPLDVLRDRERELSGRHPQDYRRLQLSPANFLGNVAALWEYTYAEGPETIHAVELTFHSGGRELALTFRAPAATWESMLPLFHSFLSSVRPPA